LQAQKTYGICGSYTIRKWIKKYGMEELLPKRVRAGTTAEIDELTKGSEKEDTRFGKSAVRFAHGLLP
jgi:hypothetical protein